MHVCQPTINFTYPSLLWSTHFNQYLLLGTTGGHDHAGWSFQLSDDLIHWSPPTALDTSSLAATGRAGGNTNAQSTEDGFTLYAYPSLLDPQSPRQNYDTPQVLPGSTYYSCRVKECSR